MEEPSSPPPGSWPSPSPVDPCLSPVDPSLPAPARPFAPPGPSGPQALDPRVRTMWHVLAAVVAVPVVGLALVAALIGVVEDLPLLVGAGAVAALAAVVIAGVAPRLRYQRWRWELTPEGLELSHGVLLRVDSAVPAFRVQQIDVRQGPVERAFGLVQLQISTASAASDGTLPGIDPERAEAVRRELLGRVAADDGV